MEFYHESIGECVNQVYEVMACTWEEAKKAAFDDMAVGDYIVMCDGSAVKAYDNWPDYHYIDYSLCEKYARLENGCWATYLDSDIEYWEERVYSFSDDPDTYLGSNGDVFDDWKHV